MSVMEEMNAVLTPHVPTQRVLIHVHVCLDSLALGKSVLVLIINNSFINGRESNSLCDY